MSDQNLTNVSPRNYVTAQQKLLIVQESYAPNQSIAEVARKYNVGVSSLLKWRKRDLVPAS